jgi:hypothetical protein
MTILTVFRSDAAWAAATNPARKKTSAPSRLTSFIFLLLSFRPEIATMRASFNDHV